MLSWKGRGDLMHQTPEYNPYLH
jgi:hypothetical protein